MSQEHEVIRANEYLGASSGCVYLSTDEKSNIKLTESTRQKVIWNTNEYKISSIDTKNGEIEFEKKDEVSHLKIKSDGRIRLIKEQN